MIVVRRMRCRKNGALSEVSIQEVEFFCGPESFGSTMDKVYVSKIGNVNERRARKKQKNANREEGLY